HGSAAITLECSAEPRSENDGASQGDKSADGVDDRGAREIVEAHSRCGPEMTLTAHVRKPTVRPPCPVADDRINETGNADAVEEVADETGPSDHSAGGDGRGGSGESELEDPYRKKRDARCFVCCWRVLEEEPVV